MKRLLLGVAAMIGVQICFGLISEIVQSLPVLIAQVIIAFFLASACGAFVAKRPFVVTSVVVWVVDFALCSYVLVNSSSTSYLTLLTSIWPVMCATLIAAAVGAQFGQWLGKRRLNAAATT